MQRRGRILSSVGTLARPFVKTLRRLVAERRLAAVKEPGWFKMRDGFWMHVNPEQYWDREVIAQGGQWEPGLTEIIKAVVGPGDLCLDIGSHKGYLSCVLAQTVGPLGRVLAFDPDPRLGEELRTNIARNGFSQVTYFPLALGDRPSKITFFLTNTLGWSTSFPNILAAPDVIEEVDVEASTVDVVLSKTLCNKPLSFVKIDAEGAEPLIWQGMQETLRHSSPVIAMEINYSSLKTGGFSLDALHGEIESQGYTAVYEVRPPTWLGAVTLVPTDIRRVRGLLIDVLMVRPHSPGFHRIRSSIALRDECG